MSYTYVVNSEKLKEQMEEQGLTAEALIFQSGIMKKTFDNMMSGVPCRCSSVYAVAGTLRCPYYNLVKDDEEEDAEKARMIKASSPLLPPQKKNG